MYLAGLTSNLPTTSGIIQPTSPAITKGLIRLSFLETRSRCHFEISDANKSALLIVIVKSEYSRSINIQVFFCKCSVDPNCRYATNITPKI